MEEKKRCKTLQLAPLACCQVAPASLHIIGHYNSEIGINSSLETLIFAPESWPSILHINPVGKNLLVEVLMFRDLPFLLTEVTSGSRRIGNQIIQFPRSNENLKTAQINQIKDSRRSISSEVTSTREPYKCLKTQQK